jgi:phosphatidate cytidylyltransferase
VGDVSNGAEVARPAALPRDLLPRAFSGAVLGAVALAGNWAGSGAFATLVLVVALIMSWEWARIVRGGTLDTALLVQAGAVVAGVVTAALGMPHWSVGLVVAASAAVLALAPRPTAWLSALGVAYVGLPAIALTWLRGSADHGALAILFIFVIVWTTDTFAYLCGRMIGGPKLWPAMSPRKTWAGTIGGLVFAALAGGMFATMLPGSAPVLLAMTALLLSIVAQIGDLAESALKRAFAVKNASDLIPGHGGFMDRMDGIVTAASLAALLALVRGAHTPAHSLLFWS